MKVVDVYRSFRFLVVCCDTSDYRISPSGEILVWNRIEGSWVEVQLSLEDREILLYTQFCEYLERGSRNEENIVNTFASGYTPSSFC